jgi:hypothetical protein
MFTPEVFYGIGAIVLLAVLAWGLMRNRGRNRRMDPVTDQATRAEYDDPKAYERDTGGPKIRPS